MPSAYPRNFALRCPFPCSKKPLYYSGMPYISQLLNNSITDSSDEVVGKLVDILISPREGAFEPLEFLAIKKSNNDIVYAPYEFVENFTTSKISLKNLFSKIAQQELPQKNFIYLKRDVLDKQIVDIGGTRVVRVNDLRIGNFDNKMSVIGIDASFRGLLRRLGLEFLFARWLQVKLIDWRQAQLLEHKSLQVNAVAENLSHLHPADLANIVEDLDVQQGSGILSALSAREAAKVLEELDPYWQSVLVKYMGPERAAKILSQMSSDEFADLVKTLSSHEAQNILSKVGGGKADKAEKLMEYSDNTAGGLMNLEFVTVRPEWTVAQATDEVKRQSPNFRSIQYVYVTQEDGIFCGVVSIRRILTSEPDATMLQLAKSLSAYSGLHPDDKIQKVIELMTRYNLYSAAVLDEERKLVGVVTVDDVLRQLFPLA